MAVRDGTAEGAINIRTLVIKCLCDLKNLLNIHNKRYKILPKSMKSIAASFLTKYRHFLEA
jgi:hypothetical protein